MSNDHPTQPATPIYVDHEYVAGVKRSCKHCTTKLAALLILQFITGRYEQYGNVAEAADLKAYIDCFKPGLHGHYADCRWAKVAGLMAKTARVVLPILAQSSAVQNFRGRHTPSDFAAVRAARHTGRVRASLRGERWGSGIGTGPLGRTNRTKSPNGFDVPPTGA